MDIMKILEQQRRTAVVSIIAYMGCLVAFISVCIKLGCISESMSGNNTSHEESEVVESTSVHQSVSVQAAPPSSFSSKGVKRKAPMADTLSEAIGSIAKSMNTIADALFDANRVAREVQPCIYNGEEIFAEVEKLELVEKNVLFAAYKLLMMDEKVAGAFFGCPPEKRKDFLLWMLNRSS